MKKLALCLICSTIALLGASHLQSAEQSEPVVDIEIFSWMLGSADEDNVERKMIELYQQLNPHVNITITEVPENQSYNDLLVARAQIGDLPDVFTWDDNIEAITNGWVTDLTPYVTIDSEWNNVLEPLRQGATYNDHTFFLPFRSYLMGMFINNDIYDENNLEHLKFGYTMDELLYAIDQTTTDTTKGTGNYFPVELFYPMVEDPDTYCYATYQPYSNTVDFTTDLYARGVEIYKTITENNNNLVNTSTEEFFGRNGWAFGEIGGIGNQYEGTWFFDSDYKINADYIGLPNGIAGVLVNDYYCIGANSDVAEQAYEFVKFMSFGLNGVRNRLYLHEINPTQYGFKGVPVIAGANAVIDTKYISAFSMYPNYISAYQSIDTAKLEGLKEIPGLSMAINDNTIEPYKMWELRDAITHGNKNLNNYDIEMTELANQVLANYNEQLKKTMGIPSSDA
ncbi:MAG: hypothetical protein ATN35_07020 [Epulopiscium sp. Nele67-Bin004]|nr:MAG: hypothetical protein ATN35_07020 [Epulopiscium sp. Nele67-Bin004]